MGGTPVSPRPQLGGLRHELHALHGALRNFDEGEERDQRYAIFADSASTMDRIASDRTTPRGGGHRGLQQAHELGQVGHNPMDSRPPTWAWRTMRWPASTQKGRRKTSSTPYMRETGVARMTEAKSGGTNSWIASHIQRRRGYRPSKGGRLRQRRHERKVLAGRPILPAPLRARSDRSFPCSRLNKILSDGCSRCGRDGRESCQHLFARCEA